MPGRAVWLVLGVALAVRLAFVAATPGYALVHDAWDYDRYARAISTGNGYPDSKRLGRATAFRPPGYPLLLAGTYVVTGVRDAPEADRILAGRLLGVGIGVGTVALIGLLAAQVWGRRVALVAMAVGAVYLPLVFVQGSVMSEPLFALLLLAACVAAMAARGSPHRYRWVVAAGVLAGLTVLTRANALVLLAPLAFAVWRAPRVSWRALGPPAVLVAVAVLTISPWSIRNAVVFDRFLPLTTQLGSAMAGTYNEEARRDPRQPASWRGLRRVEEYRHIYKDVRTTPEPVLEDELRGAALAYIREHPEYVLEVAYWSTRRMLDSTGMNWSRHTLSTIGVPRSWTEPMVLCFWLFGVIAVAGCLTRDARRAPRWLWAVPVLLFLSVVFLVVETPRYRTGIDPFIVLASALALTALGRRIDALRSRATPSPGARSV